MEMKVLVVFIVCNIINVIIQTVKSIATIRCGKTMASIVNAVAYGFYTYIVILTMSDLPLFTKCIVVALCNLVGVYVVKWGEEKARKDKVWLVKITIPTENAEQAKHFLEQAEISFTYYDLQKYFVFDTFCDTQEETTKVLQICKTCGGKAFATENKLGL